jgi:hypothetical protein
MYWLLWVVLSIDVVLIGGPFCERNISELSSGGNAVRLPSLTMLISWAWQTISSLENFWTPWEGQLISATRN